MLSMKILFLNLPAEKNKGSFTESLFFLMQTFWRKHGFKSCGGQLVEAFSCLEEQAEPGQPHRAGWPCSVARMVIPHAAPYVIAEIPANTPEL